MPPCGTELVTHPLDLDQLEAAVREHTKLIRALTESVRHNRKCVTPCSIVRFPTQTEGSERVRVVGDATLHLGDCIEVMKLIPDASVDLILCDLP